MKTLDTVLVLLIWLAVGAISLLYLVRRSRGHVTGFGQTGNLPRSWRRWLLGEKRSAPRPR